MIKVKKVAISLLALALISTVVIFAFSTPIFASTMTEQTNPTFVVSTIEGEARVDGVLVGTASIEFTAMPAAGGPIHLKDHTIRIFKITEGSIIITVGEIITTYDMIPETWEGISRVNGRSFIAVGDVEQGENEFVVALHGFAVAHFFSDDSTVMRLDGTLRGNDLNYQLVFIIEGHLEGMI